MKTLIANFALGALWMALTGRATGWNFFFGLGLGYAVLRATQGPRRRSAYFRKLPEAIGFFTFFVRELVVSSLRVAYDVVTPSLYMRPAVLGVPLTVTTDAEITLLACLITLTPGTLTLDVSDDRKTLFVHAMYVHDYELARATIQQGFERRVSRLLR
jgi:multicomponent Na+:H+ antiporter subunit E